MQIFGKYWLYVAVGREITAEEEGANCSIPPGTKYFARQGPWVSFSCPLEHPARSVSLLTSTTKSGSDKNSLNLVPKEESVIGCSNCASEALKGPIP